MRNLHYNGFIDTKHRMARESCIISNIKGLHARCMNVLSFLILVYDLIKILGGLQIKI